MVANQILKNSWDSCHMPCRDDYWPDQGVYGKIQKLTRLLCWACQNLDQTDSWEAKGIGELWSWWQAHKAADEARKARESQNLARIEAKKELIARLSPAERELLGISDRETFQLGPP